MEGLTAEQQEFLKSCEAEFSFRYTDDDKEFMQVIPMLIVIPIPHTIPFTFTILFPIYSLYRI